MFRTNSGGYAFGYGLADFDAKLQHLNAVHALSLEKIRDILLEAGGDIVFANKLCCRETDTAFEKLVDENDELKDRLMYVIPLLSVRSFLIVCSEISDRLSKLLEYVHNFIRSYSSGALVPKATTRRSGRAIKRALTEAEEILEGKDVEGFGDVRKYEIELAIKDKVWDKINSTF